LQIYNARAMPGVLPAWRGHSQIKKVVDKTAIDDWCRFAYNIPQPFGCIAALLPLHFRYAMLFPLR
jgi:hypothetical protein